MKIEKLRNYISESTLKKAKELAKNPKELFTIIGEADAKAHTSKAKKAFDGLIEDLKALFRLVKAWATLDYNQVQWQTIILGITGILYFISPFDAIFDLLPFGLIDDAYVVATIIGMIKTELEEFKKWETAKSQNNHGRAASNSDSNESSSSE